MDTTRALMPRARQDELHVEEVQDETLVYDLKRDMAHCLNQTAAVVWQHCDGQTSVADVAGLLEEQFATPIDEAVVWMALDRLGRTHLLTEPVTLPADRAQYSRRNMLRTLRRAAGISLLLPVIESIVAPLAAAQGSCVTVAVCATFPPTSCGGAPICGSPGQCCRRQGQGCVSKAC